MSNADSPLGWGAYPMVPWAGRLAHAELRFDDVVHRFPVDMETHAIHGTGYTSIWQRVSPNTLELDLTDPWPFGGRVWHSLRLGADRVRFELTIEADTPMPAQFGWHPWFRRVLDRPGSGELEVVVAPQRMLELDGHAIPTGRLVPPAPPPWDNCFVDLAMPPRLTWEGVGTIELRTSCDHWVIFDQPEHAVCVEPQSGPPNGLNRDPHVVEPGEPLRGWFEIVAAD